ncbi:integrase, catalytic region, zinc finger, CCHC-type containing protein [Tanacetum coccineum]
MDILDVKKSCVNNCNKCLELETELFKKKDFIEKEDYDKLVKSYSNLEKHCILLELATQLNQEFFQRENSGENLNALTFNHLFEINELKAQSQEKDTVIRKLKERIKSLSGKDCVENVKKDIDEIETINIELEHKWHCRKTKPNSCGSCPHYVDIFKSSSFSMGRSNQHSLLHPKPFSDSSPIHKTPYELMHDKKPDLSFFHFFGSLCYLTNDSEDLGKLNAKADIGIFVGYAPAKKALRIYKRRTQKILVTIHVTFDELTATASKQFGLGPELQVMTPVTSSSGLVPNVIPQQPFQVATAPRAIDIADSHVSTSIDQDASSSSIPSTQEQEHSQIISQGVEESPKTPLFHDDPLYKFLHEDLTSQG